MAKRRKPGSGSVRLRKDGRWEGRVVIGYDEKGLPKTKNVLAKTKGECVEKLKKLRESITPPMPAKIKADMSFGDWLNFWYEDYCKPKVRLTTQQRYEELMRQHIIPKLGNIPLNELTQPVLQQFYVTLKESGRKKNVERYGPGLSDRTVRNCHALCHAALEKAVEENLINRNPANGCKLPPSRPKEMQVLTAEEMQRLLIQSKEESFFELFLLELSTGLRRGEICALQWDDLNFTTGELRIERQVHRVKGELAISQPKTKASNRSVVLPLPILKVLKEYRKTVTSRWMFPSPVSEDAPRDPTAVRKRLFLILEHAECKHIRFHDLRHTFATNALEHGMDIKTLSTIIGHVSSATTLNVYAHVTDDMKKDAALKIDHGIAGAEPQVAPKAMPKEPVHTTFQAKKGKYRKPGTGCISQINDRLWEGRYSPKVNGKRVARNVYAHSETECERLLAEMIAGMKAEIVAERERLKSETKTSW